MSGAFACWPFAQAVRRAAWGVAWCCIVAACSSDRPAPGTQSTSEFGHAVDTADVTTFVRQYFLEYSAMLSQGGDSIPYERMLNRRPTPFADSLQMLLRRELALQEEAGGDIVHLDADPFTGSQDPCDEFAVGAVTFVRQDVRVEVFSICNGHRLDTPAVTAIVGQQEGRWVILDVEYPGATRRTLMELLAQR